MTDHESATGDDRGVNSKRSDETGNEPPCDSAKGITDNDENKHVVRIVGTYSLFTFFKKEAQEKFFKTITSREFESIFDPSPQPTYATDTGFFLFSGEERRFELRMTNMGFIREGFWREAFPPIFQLNGGPKAGQTWQDMLPACTKANLQSVKKNPKSDKCAEALFYEFCLDRLDKELSDVGGQQEIHIGLNRFGIVNIGITIKWDRSEDKSFEALCKDAYKKVSHLQEDPFEDLKREADALTAGDSEKLKVSRALDTRDCPRLVVSYFQVLAITTIHRFLHDKLAQGAIGGFKQEQLADAWELSNKIPESARNGLPPLRHVVFMYQLVHSIDDKTSFLKNNKRALLTLGHNVGWSPSDNPPFPLFDSRRAKLNDSSLLETSCCLIFPQGLVVVIPRDRDGSEGVQTLYPGGMHDNTSSSRVTYRDYWKLIFKLFIRVAEARLLIGMVTRELADIHKAFLKNRQALWGTRSLRVLIGWSKGKSGIDRTSKIHSQLMRVGSIIQRTSGRVITPEVTRYSFVRRKLTDFLETVNFEEHRASIQSEFEKLNEWVIAIRTAWVARAAIVVAIAAAILTLAVTVKMPWLPEWLNPDGVNSACANQTRSESVNGISGEMDKLKTTTAAVNSELGNLQGKIEALARDLETVKRCKHHNRKHTNVHRLE